MGSVVDARGRDHFQNAATRSERGRRGMAKDKGKVRLVKDGDRPSEFHRTFETAVDFPPRPGLR